MKIFRTKFESWCKWYFSPIKLASLRKLVPSRNAVCTGTSSVRMAWTLSLKYLSVKSRLSVKKGWFLEVESQQFIRRRTRFHNPWLLLVLVIKARCPAYQRNRQRLCLLTRVPVSTKYELRAAGCGLLAAGCGLRTADCGLRTADCGLRTGYRTRPEE